MATVIAPVRSVVIVGFGLIGASIAAATRARDPSVYLTAADRNSVVSDPAVRAGVDVALDVSDEGALTRAFARAELVVLAAPIHVIEQQLPLALRHSACVTDCGSTKRRLVEIASRSKERERFVPGHPMAGASRGGFRAADPALFQDRRWLLCPGLAAPQLEQRVREWVSFLGAQAEDLSPEEHDGAVAVTSHLPQLLASLLTVIAEERQTSVAAGPGFASATRVAGGNISVWEDIFDSNADEIAAISADLAERLHRFSEDLARGETRTALELLEAASAVKSREKGCRVISRRSSKLIGS